MSQTQSVCAEMLQSRVQHSQLSILSLALMVMDFIAKRP